MDDFDNSNSDDLVGGLLVLAVLSLPVMIYKAIKSNKKESCYDCKKVFRSKELRIVNFDSFTWPDGWIIPRHIKLTIDKFNDKNVCNECADKIMENIAKTSCYVCCNDFPVNDLCKVSFDKSVWPNGYDLPHNITLFIDKYADMIVCNECGEALKNNMLALLKEETENLYVNCPRCNKGYLPKELQHNEMPEYPSFWVIENTYSDKKICGSCRRDIRDEENDRYVDACKRSKVVKTYPKTYLGDKRINQSSIRNGIESGYYKNRDHAWDELRLYAFLEGYDIVFDIESEYITMTKEAGDDYDKPDNYQHGYYHYKEWKARGNFALSRK